MKKRFLFVLVAICAISLGLSVSCGKTAEESQPSESIKESLSGRYTIEGVTDIALSVDQTEYDFLKGIVGWEEQTVKEVAVDSSAVQFGNVGAYEVVYTLGDVTEKAVVRVYGTPEITGDIYYAASYSENIDVFANVFGKDSFGMELLVTTNNEFEQDDFGRIIYGEHFFRYYVTDAVGNVAYLDRTYTVLPPDGYLFDDVIVTVAEPEVKIDIKDKVLNYVVYKGNKIPVSEYSVKDGILDLSYFAVDQGVGEHVYNLSFDGGYANVLVDMQITPQQFYGRSIMGEEMVNLFTPYKTKASNTNFVNWDNDEGAYHFNNFEVAQYDDRGFYLDKVYFSNVIAKGKAVKMTFDFKYDSEPIPDDDPDTPDHAFFLGFIPDWFNKPTMQQFYYADGYQSVTIDLTKVDMVDGQYKSLFMLSTVGGFYVKNIKFKFAAI